MNSLQRARIAELDAEHARLGEHRADLLRQLKEVERRMKRCEVERANCMPVNALPNEILCTILRYAFRHDRGECIRGASADPMPISHISRRFRTAMLEMPDLWACIHIDFGQRRATRKMRPRLETFLARSQPGPIAVHLRRLSFEWDYAIQTPDAPYAPLFAADARLRWQHLTVTCRTRVAVDQAVVSLPYFPALQTVQLEPVEPGLTIASDQPQHSLPSLRRMRVREVMVPFASPLLYALRELLLADSEVSVDYVREVARAAPQLERLVLECMVFDTDGPDWSSPPPIRLPALRALVLVRPMTTGYERILAWLKAPLLARIELYNIRELLAVTVPWTAALPALRTLRVVACDFCWARLDALRTLSRDVTDLDLSGTISDRVLEELTVDVGGPTPLTPSLDTLTVTSLKPRLANTLLPDLLRVRKEAGRPIKRLRLGEALHGTMAEGALKAMAEFAEIVLVDPTVTPQYWAAALPDYMAQNYATDPGSP